MVHGLDTLSTNGIALALVGMSTFLMQKIGEKKPYFSKKKESKFSGTKDGCIFCNRKMFEDKIVWENKSFLLIATIGQISDSGYVLLVPKKHISCIGSIDKEEMKDLQSLFFEIEYILSEEYNISPITVFEHGVVGQSIPHAHIHFIPVVCNLTNEIRDTFQANEIVEVQTLEELRCLYFEKQLPYLMWRGIDRRMNVCLNPQLPEQYMRTVVARLINYPERADWKNVNKELDDRLRRETIRRLFPYLEGKK